MTWSVTVYIASRDLTYQRCVHGQLYAGILSFTLPLDIPDGGYTATWRGYQ